MELINNIAKGHVYSVFAGVVKELEKEMIVPWNDRIGV